MYSIKYPLALFLIGVCLVACAQENYGIKRMVAFRSLRMPGNIPVDENGNSLFKGPDTINTIYVETTRKGIQWDTAWRNGRAYTVAAELLSTASFDAGTDKRTGKKIVLTAANGNQQWLLQLEPLENNQKVPVTSLKSGEILLKGKYGKSTIMQTIKQQTELDVLPAY